MGKRRPAEVWPVAEFINEFIEARGWNLDRLIAGAGCPAEAITDVMAGKPVSEAAARGLSRAFGTSRELWLNLDRAFWEALADAVEVADV